ncbi:MAG: D-alanine--D-alanine ligase [Acidimicrobiales bacterium]|nr:MAG: D-alanine--D-alanine ligase [Acidimicrobiales bacterium]
MPAGDDRTLLVIIFGGESAEHEVSCVSARHVAAAADPARYDVVPLGIARDGGWHLAEEDRRRIREGDEPVEALSPEGPEVDPLAFLRDFPRTSEGGRTVVFPLVHGPYGEDGTLQGLLEIAAVPYVGCGVLASALAMDKAKAKEVLASHGLPQTRHLVVSPRDDPAELATRVQSELAAPWFVKPANLGSSVGVTKVTGPDELAAALRLARRFDEWVLVEEGVSGREIEVGVLGNLQLRTSVAGEVIPGAEFYDYEDKYLSDRARLVIPAELEDDAHREVRRLAVAAAEALRVEGMARVDFFYEPSGRGFLVNEVNTIPGFTPKSMYPMLWQHTGLGYGELVDELVRLAFERFERRSAARRAQREVPRGPMPRQEVVSR